MRILMFESFAETAKKKTLVCVDIQPAYKVKFSVSGFFDFLNGAVDEYNKVIYLYNGPRLGYGDLSELQMWMYTNGFEEEKLDKVNFFEKEYGYLRVAMDEGCPDSIISALVKWMIDNGVGSSGEITEDQWASIGGGMDMQRIKEMSDGGDCIYLPDNDIMELLNSLTAPIDMVGGQEVECLNEIEILLDAIGKEHRRINAWIY